ncbi:MAG: hypothetical protein PHI06_10950 [Desulfobulbaceae bacterium]|nr:hypothetical protein [Desulfobulbaceae bacterium]
MQKIYGSLIIGGLLILPVSGYAGEGEQLQTRSRWQVQSQLATPEERAAHQLSMQNSRTQEEREALRKEHSAAMQSRAGEQGLPAGQTQQRRMGGGGGMRRGR